MNGVFMAVSIRSYRALAAVLGASVLVTGLAACSSSSSNSGGGASASGSAAAQPVSLSMGIEPWIGYAPWYIAQEKGYFTAHGLNVNIVNFTTDADRNAAIIAGKTDVSNIDAGRLVQWAEQKQPVEPVMIEDASVGADAILSSPDITTAQQVVGKDVAYEYGTTSELLFRYFLNANNITIDQVKTTNVPAADAGTLLIAGKTPVVGTYEPYISAATGGANAGKAHVLFGSDKAPGLISDFLAINKTWLAANPGAVKNLILAWDDAMKYYASNHDDAVAIMAKGVGSKPSDLTATLAGVKLYTVQDNKDMFASGEMAKNFAGISTTLQLMGNVKAPVTLDQAGSFTYFP